MVRKLLAQCASGVLAKGTDQAVYARLVVDRRALPHSFVPT